MMSQAQSLSSLCEAVSMSLGLENAQRAKYCLVLPFVDRLQLSACRVFCHIP